MARNLVKKLAAFVDCTYVFRFPDVVSALDVPDDLVWVGFAAAEGNAAGLAGSHRRGRTVEINITIPILGTFDPATLKLGKQNKVVTNNN